MINYAKRVEKGLLPKYISWSQASKIEEGYNMIIDEAIENDDFESKEENGELMINTVELLDFIDELDEESLEDKRKNRLKLLKTMKQDKAE